MSREENDLQQRGKYGEADVEVSQESGETVPVEEDEDYESLWGYHSFYGF